MAAPRNDEERARLYAAAMRLFGEKGYVATSYQDIADACDTSKSVVQHYYPRKEMPFSWTSISIGCARRRASSLHPMPTSCRCYA